MSSTAPTESTDHYRPLRIFRLLPDLELAESRKLEEIIACHEQMAKASRLVMGIYNELLQTASSLEDQGYRELMRECITRPKITFLELHKSDQDRRRLFDEMVRRGFFNIEDDPDHVWPPGHLSPQTYLTAPSSHNDFYNAHPGGLAVTVAYNIRMADAYTENYRQMYGIPANRDLPVVSLLVHDIQKFGSISGRRRLPGSRNRAPSMTTPGTPTASM